ncbi:hypothetical protein DBV15_02929 [Temnothorax longispinosus]|uniref:Uncharacterized protein n=1 Tax=Temnothorax longispinosus TaxID=300112 RepID=A0A4S2JSI8_9HYME|nr:hypothetical protein DBV15_02929 [Temnothorax longispinosus]
MYSGHPGENNDDVCEVRESCSTLLAMSLRKCEKITQGFDDATVDRSRLSLLVRRYVVKHAQRKKKQDHKNIKYSQ